MTYVIGTIVEFAIVILIHRRNPETSQARSKGPLFENQISSNNSEFKKLAIQKLYDNLGNLTYNLQETSKNQEEIFSYIKDLADNLNKLTVSIQEQDKKLSNFLTTQLNTQSSMLQLTTKLTQEGVMDSESRKHLKNLDIGIQKLVAGTKTKRK